MPPKKRKNAKSNNATNKKQQTQRKNDKLNNATDKKQLTQQTLHFAWCDTNRQQQPAPSLAEQEEADVEKATTASLADVRSNTNTTTTGATIVNHNNSSETAIDLRSDSEEDTDDANEMEMEPPAATTNATSLPDGAPPLLTTSTQGEDVAPSLACLACMTLNRDNYISCGVCGTLRVERASPGSDYAAATTAASSRQASTRITAPRGTVDSSSDDAKKPAARTSSNPTTTLPVLPHPLRFVYCQPCTPGIEVADEYCTGIYQEDCEGHWEEEDDSEEQEDYDWNDDCASLDIPSEAMSVFPSREEYAREASICMRTESEVEFNYPQLQAAEKSGIFKRSLQKVALCPSRDKSSADGTADDTPYGNYSGPLREQCRANGTYAQPLHCSATCPKLTNKKDRCKITIPRHLVFRWLIFNARILRRWGLVHAVSFGGSKTNPIVARLERMAPGLYGENKPTGIHRTLLSKPYPICPIFRSYGKYVPQLQLARATSVAREDGEFFERNDITHGWFQVAVHIALVQFVTETGIGDVEVNSVYEAQLVARGRLAAAALRNKIESQGKNYSEYMSKVGKLGGEALKRILVAQGIDVSEYFQALGAKGAAGLKRSLASRGIDVSEYHQALGARGAAALKKKVESQGSNMSEYMSDLARKDDNWGESLAHLVEFQNEKGHANVPQGHMHKGFALGTWCDNQRRIYKSCLEKPGGVPPYMQGRYKQLEAVGFHIFILSAKWEKMYHLLVGFQKEKGHASVPQKYTVVDATGVHAQLGEWCKTQKKRNKKNLENHRVLTKDEHHQFERLKKVGMKL